MFAWIAAAPYLLIGSYKVPALWFGWVFGVNAAGFMIAAQINRRLLRHHRADVILRYGAMGGAAAGVVLLVDALTGLGGGFGVMIPLFFVVASLGFVSSNAMAGGLAIDPSRAGTISALFGAGQFALAGVATSAVGLISKTPAIGMACVIIVCAVGTLVAALLATGPGRRPAQSPSPG